MKEKGRCCSREKAFVVLSLVSTAVLISLKFLPWESLGEAGLLFVGRTHPIWLHLPIGVIASFFLVELINFFRPKKSLDHASDILLSFAILSSLPTLCSGYLLASTGEYAPGYVESHEDFAWWMAFILSLLPLLRIQTKKWGVILYRCGLGAVLMLMTIAGHKGGELTHGSDFLTELLPRYMQEFLGTAEEKSEGEKEGVMDLTGSPSESVTFEKNILPILDEYCFRCHGPKKQKGDIRLDSLSADFSDPEEMGLWELSLLQHLYGEMPPEGKAQLSKEEGEMFFDWILSSLKEARKDDD